MPVGFTLPSSEYENVVGIQFGIFSPDEIVKRSVVEITTEKTYDGAEPRIGGLFDPRMGVLENGKTCRSCGQTNHNCPGHFGHYRLARPVYFYQFKNTIMSILKCICIRCSKLLIDKEDHQKLLKRRGESRWREVLSLCDNVSRCGQHTEDGCGTIQPTRYVVERIATVVAQWDDERQNVTQVLDVEYVQRLFRQITDEDVDFMGFSRHWCRPDWMICSVLPVPPPQVRPSVIQDNNQRSEDDLTHKLFEIIRTNRTLQDKIDNNTERKQIEEYTEILQYHIATLVDNKIPGVPPSAQRGGRPLKSLQQRIGSKEGRMRYNIQGKRVEQSARTVITPDPNLSIAEVGVPIKIAMNLSRPERVTQFTREKLYKYVQNGTDVFPGAKSIIRKDGRMISLKHVNTKEIQLYDGDIVNRHLMDGDILLFNRQPTLHRMSMMGHRVRVLPYNTFRLNVSVCSAYNADFDGDEMNAHLPQSSEAIVELEDIAAVPWQIVRPRDAKPIIDIVQDTLVGSYLATKPNNSFNRREFMNLMMWNKRFSQLPAAMQDPETNKTYYNGAQIISSLLPPVNIMTKTKLGPLEIEEGQLKKGLLSKPAFNQPGSGIVHTTFNDYGPMEAVKLIDSLQTVLESYLIMKGFSVGVSDLIADEKTRKDMEEVIKQKKQQIEQIILQVHMDLFTNNTGKTNQEEFESRIFAILNKAVDEAGKLGENSLAEENRLICMVRAGSKGSTVNIAQMIACVGQQNVEGKRTPYGFTDRTLPHYKKYDDGAESRGFVESSFVRGLNPQEFFFHAMSGREGLIDTAVKSVTGDTPIVILEDGIPKYVEIGPWIDAQLDAKKESVKHYEERQMELLDLTQQVYIPTMDEHGVVTWGELTAITRHDPGTELYEIKTSAGKRVIVTESKSLLVWKKDTETFQEVPTPTIQVGDYVPTTMNLCKPPTFVNTIDLTKYFPKDKYIYGTEFHKARNMVDVAMEGRRLIPNGWWEAHNGIDFTLPYTKKAKLTRTLARSNIENIKEGCIYPYHATRIHGCIPDIFTLNNENGIFLGLFLAEGNASISSGTIQITNINENIKSFVKHWFDKYSIKYEEKSYVNKIGGTTSFVVGYSTLLARFLTELVGHGAKNKFVPSEAFVAPDEFIVGLLNGYFSGDGTIGETSVEAGSASPRLMEGISMCLTRLGIFGKVFTTQTKENNIGTKNIAPSHRIAIRAQWAAKFVNTIPLLDDTKQEKLKELRATSVHRNYTEKNDVVLDEITEINIIDVSKYPKVYDVTVPSTLNFGLANGLQVRDTSETGYTQRRLIKAMEDLMVQHDGTVRDANNNIVQFYYGEDGLNSTKIEMTELKLQDKSDVELAKMYGLEGVDITSILQPNVQRDNDSQMLADFVTQGKEDRTMIVERVFHGARTGDIFGPLNLDRIIFNLKIKFRLNNQVPTDLTPRMILEGIQQIIDRTYPYNKTWCALLRYHLCPYNILVEKRFTKEAWETLVNMVITKVWKAGSVPGELVGIIAAQSIGEPTTQMSCVGSTKITVHGKDFSYDGPIDKFIDSMIENNKERVLSLGNDSLVYDPEDNYYITGVSQDEKSSWNRILQVSRHPANGKLVEVKTRSGRFTTATLSHSFLKRNEKGIESVKGSDLVIGDRIPVAKYVPIVPNPIQQKELGNNIVQCDYDFGWVCGLYLNDGLIKDDSIVFSHYEPYMEERLQAFAKTYHYPLRINVIESEFGTVKNFVMHSSALQEYFVQNFGSELYRKEMSGEIFHMNYEFLRGLLSGCFDSAGNIHGDRQLIRFTMTSKVLSQQIAKLCSYFGFFGSFGEEVNVEKRQYVYMILRKYAKEILEVIRIHDAERAKGLQLIVDYNNRDNVHSNMELIDKLPFCGRLIAETATILHMPSCSRIYRRWLKKESVGRETLRKYIRRFNHALETNKGITLEDRATVTENVRLLQQATESDVVWDEITELNILDDPKTYVYDFTVPGNDSFMVDDNIYVHNTLNTFHLAGVAAKSNMTRGVPRLKELLQVTHNPKATSLTVYLKPEFRENKDRVREVIQDLEITLLKDITLKAGIYYDPKEEESIIEEDRELIEFFRAFEALESKEDDGDDDKWNKWMLRLEFDREKMFNRNITMDDVHYVLKERFAEDIHMVYSDYNSSKLVMRIRITDSDPLLNDDLNSLKKFQNRILNNIVIRGVPGIRAVTFRKSKDMHVLKDGKYEQIEQYVLDTDGSNFLEVMNHPAVDGNRIYSTNVHDIYEQLGIEAARQVLYSEMAGLFEEAGINYRHLCLLVDVMTHPGRLISVDRYGINKNDNGPLAKACFEETDKILRKAAQFGEIDPVTGVSANVMTGQTIRGGTAFSQILLDEEALPALLANEPLIEHYDEPDDRLTEQNIQAVFAEDDNNMCSQTRLSMNINLPVGTGNMEDEEELEIITV